MGILDCRIFRWEKEAGTSHTVRLIACRNAAIDTRKAFLYILLDYLQIQSEQRFHVVLSTGERMTNSR
uniref:Transposase n=1 Tax=Syphacia muris TaxID=451379 RepID=A0A0N5AW44_9BILA